MRFFRFAIALLVAASTAGAWAQSYPTRPVKIVVGFAPGSATDTLARIVAEAFTRSMGQPFVVENKPGAGGSIGAAQVKEAPADGYTLVAAGSGPFGINPAVQANLPYDAVRDFELIGNIVLTPQAIVVSSTTPWKTLREFVAAAKAKPGDIPYASLGKGSTSHLAMAAFASTAGIELNHIPFKGSGDAQAAILSGQVPVMSDTIPGVLTQVKAGKLRALAVAIPRRSQFLPDVPTVAEEGWAGFESVGWIGLAAPAKTPAPILDKLNAEIRKMLADPAVKAKFEQLAFEPVGDSRAQFTAFVKSEIAKWSQVARATGSTLD
jgi:tripartite-type tricarboxylate transporter receptor subunit TctC